MSHSPLKTALATEATGKVIDLMEALKASLGLVPPATAAPSHPALVERIAQIQAHRACGGAEHDLENGRIHGYCVVCLVPWPCTYAGTPAGDHP